MTRASRIHSVDDLREAAETELAVSLALRGREFGCGCAAHCRLCGCGDHHACEGGCSWVEDPFDAGPLCSECLPVVAELYTDLVTLEALGIVERFLAEDGELRIQPAELDIGGLSTSFTP